MIFQFFYREEKRNNKNVNKFYKAPRSKQIIKNIKRIFLIGDVVVKIFNLRL